MSWFGSISLGSQLISTFTDPLSVAATIGGPDGVVVVAAVRVAMFNVITNGAAIITAVSTNAAYDDEYFFFFIVIFYSHTQKRKRER